MPNMNGTGPNGMGPMTGRGAGLCGQGQGRGMGRGGVRGMGGRGMNAVNFPYQPTKKEYVEKLKAEIKDLQDELKELDS